MMMLLVCVFSSSVALNLGNNITLCCALKEPDVLTSLLPETRNYSEMHGVYNHFIPTGVTRPGVPNVA